MALPPESAPATALCIRCGYSLRGLPASGLCPECATPVERSLHGDMLVFSDPSYVNELVLAARLILVSVLLRAITFLASTALSLAKATGAAQVSRYLHVALTGLFLLGWWKLTTPDPGQLTTNKGEKPRQVARIAILAVAAITVLDTLLRQMVAWSTPITLTMTIASYTAVGTAFFSCMLYLRWLSPRIPSTKLYQYARTLMIFIAVVFTLQLGATITLMIVLRAALASTSGVPFTLLVVSNVVIGIGNFAALVMYFKVFSLLRKELLAVQLEQSPLGLPPDRGFQDPSINP